MAAGLLATAVAAVGGASTAGAAEPTYTLACTAPGATSPFVMTLTVAATAPNSVPPGGPIELSGITMYGTLPGYAITYLDVFGTLEELSTTLTLGVEATNTTEGTGTTTPQAYTIPIERDAEGNPLDVNLEVEFGSVQFTAGSSGRIDFRQQSGASLTVNVDAGILGTVPVRCTPGDREGSTIVPLETIPVLASTFIVTVDDHGPTAAPVQSPAANAAGWNNTDVTVNWNWTDGGSGIDPAACTTSSVSTGEGSAITLTATCADLAGNSATAEYTVKVDKTPPVVTVTYTPEPNSFGWTNAPTAYSFETSDSLSGLDDPNCAFLARPPEVWVGGVTVGDCRDVAGNWTSRRATLRVDVVSPTAALTAARPPDVDGWYNAPVSFTTTGTDPQDTFTAAVSGIDTCTAPQNYTGPDSSSAALSGTCTDRAGNVGATATTGPFKFDDTDPLITVTGARVYRVGETVEITCTASDATSGVADTDCGSFTEPAIDSKVGEYTTVFTAIDRAGNEAMKEITYSVVAPVAPTLEVVPGGTCVSGNSGRITLRIVNPDGQTVGAFAATSSDTRVVPRSGIVLSGTGTTRTLTVTGVSGRSGTSTITVQLGNGPATTITYLAGGNRRQTLTGTAGTDLIFGGNDVDTINGLAGIDLLCGNNGNDRLTGGTFDDTVNGGNGADVLTDREPGDTVVSVP